jgi:5'-methylthioadenosine phosphorylase
VLAVIGGSGLAQLGNLEVRRRKLSPTPYGEPSGALAIGRIADCDVIFLARHGEGHSIAPHEVNYRANLWALKDAGAAEVIAVAAVGAIRKDLAPGALLLPNQVIDYTWGRRSSYFEGPGAPVNHIDFTEPYSRELRSRLLNAALACGEQLLEVGMTGMPEAALAREISLQYAAITAVANYAAGRGDSRRAVPLDRIGAVLDEAMGRVRKIIDRFCRE